ncbi:MAG: hypothetical protein ACTHLR_12890 [Rhizomicrobium sp.]
MSTITLTGISGRTYDLHFCDMAQPWAEVPGVYAFITHSLPGTVVKYVGECENFKSRMSSHERWDEGRRRYAVTAIVAMRSNNDVSRFEIERDLIAAYNPPMNTHHRTASAGLAAALTPNNALRAFTRR